MPKSLFTVLFLASLTLSQAAFAKGPVAQAVSYGEPISTMISVSFADNSAAFRPTDAQLELLQDVRDASMVTISGRTSTNKASAKDEALALARAVSARAWLVARGVSPLKIMINYVSAADYAADNSTPEGRYINQRVDVELFYVPRY